MSSEDSFDDSSSEDSSDGESKEETIEERVSCSVPQDEEEGDEEFDKRLKTEPPKTIPLYQMVSTHKEPKLLNGKDVPKEFFCPITTEIMFDPVIAEDQVTYERDAIQKWVEVNHSSPAKRIPLTEHFIPNLAI